MSGELDGMLATLRALERAPEEVARDVAALLAPRFRSPGGAVAQGDQVVLRGGFLSDEWAADVANQAQETLARLGGAR